MVTGGGMGNRRQLYLLSDGPERKLAWEVGGGMRIGKVWESEQLKSLRRDQYKTEDNLGKKEYKNEEGES